MITKLGFKKHAGENEAMFADIWRAANRLDDVAIAIARNYQPQLVKDKDKVEKKVKRTALDVIKKVASMGYGMTENSGPQIMITELTPEVMQDLSEPTPDPPKGTPGAMFERGLSQNNVVLSRLNRALKQPVKSLSNFADPHLTYTQKP